jgi:hypothetical protein
VPADPPKNLEPSLSAVGTTKEKVHGLFTLDAESGRAIAAQAMTLQPLRGLTTVQQNKPYEHLCIC